MPLPNEKCHADNQRDIFRALHPQAFDPGSPARPPLSSELNILAEAREDCGNQDCNTPRRMLRKAGPAQANPCSLDQDTWKGRSRSLLAGRQGIAVVPLRSCGRASPVSSWRQRNPSPQFSCCQNSLWVATQSLCSVRVWWTSLEERLRLSWRVKANSLSVWKVTERMFRSTSDFWGSVESSSRSRSIVCNLRARGTSRPGIQEATLPKTSHEEEVADPGAERTSRCR